MLSYDTALGPGLCCYQPWGSFPSDFNSSFPQIHKHMGISLFKFSMRVISIPVCVLGHFLYLRSICSLMIDFSTNSSSSPLQGRWRVSFQQLPSSGVKALISLAFCKYELVDCRAHPSKHMLKSWHSVSSQWLAGRIFSGWGIQDLDLQNGAKNPVRILRVDLSSNHSLPQHLLRLLCLLRACKWTSKWKEKMKDSWMYI